MLTRILREPLLHFVALGALLFALHGSAGHRSGRSSERIVVTRGQVEQLSTTFERTWQRPPTPEELDGLVDDWIRTEVAYRQAVALGLDEGDSVVRRRLRQKLEFVTEDATQATPSDDDLRAYLAEHADEFRTSARLTFTQIYLSPERRDDVDADARALLARLDDQPEADGADLGDPLMVPPEMVDAPRAEVASVFGDTFADGVEAAPIGRWWGPVESGYGVHLVRVRRRVESDTPALGAVRPSVLREWQNARRLRMLDEAYRRMRARYEIVVEPIDDGPAEATARR